MSRYAKLAYGHTVNGETHIGVRHWLINGKETMRVTWVKMDDQGKPVFSTNHARGRKIYGSYPPHGGIIIHAHE